MDGYNALFPRVRQNYILQLAVGDKRNHLLHLYIPISRTVQFLKPENLLGRIHYSDSEWEM